MLNDIIIIIIIINVLQRNLTEFKSGSYQSSIINSLHKAQ
jgi:hypothetical protein